MTWELLGVVAALLAAQGVNVAVVRAVVRSEVAKLNGTYMRTGICEVRHEATDKRLDRLETQSDIATVQADVDRGRTRVSFRDEERRLSRLENTKGDLGGV